MTILLAAAGFVAVWVLARRWALTYLRYVILAAVACLILAPFAWLIAAAFKDPDVLNEFVFFPPISEWSSETINLKNFRELFTPKESLQGTLYFWVIIANSLFLAGAATVTQLFFSSLAGYALAKYRFAGKGILMAVMLGSMMIPPVILLAPTYEIIVKIGWFDTYWALIVPGAVSVFGIFLFRQAIVGVPNDLIESGRIDGCGEFRIYLQLVMPLVRPMTGAFCLVAFLGAWNSFIAPNVYLSTQSKLPLTVVLNQYVGEYQQQYGVFLAGTLLAIIPPAILFFALQREFISGLTTGAVKG
ncbi:MAG: carbohydrate ABC transporter permease [Chthoniobacterales bacterium]